MSEQCPDCGSNLRARRPNFLTNIRRRSIGSRYDRYVCPSCDETFSREEIVEAKDESISIQQWMEGRADGGGMTGTFITVEGIDGAGKTLAVEAIEEEFDPVTTSEPSDYWTGEQVRRALREETPPFMDFFLLMADRHHHIEEVIKPQIEKGNIVVSDRFADSTRAYQPVQFEEHIGDRSALGWIEKVMAPWNYEPDLTIYLKVSVETGLARCDQEEKYETKEMLEQVKENYESWIGFPTTEESRPSNHRRRDFAVIDAEQSKKQVRSEVVEVVEEVLND